MGYETTPFGDGVSTTRVTTVSNHFSGRGPGKTVGVVKTEGSMHEMKLSIDGDMLTADAFALIAPNLPKGAVIEDVYLKVDEVFAITGSSVVIDIGTSGSEATNGFTITEAQLQTVTTVDLTSALSGTWAAPLAASTTVGIVMSGTTPVSDGSGKAAVVVRYALVGAAQ